MRTYTYEIEGAAADDQTWATSGHVTCTWAKVFDAIMRDSFQQLTGGKAVFGKPGVGCRGPYAISALAIREQGDLT